MTLSEREFFGADVSGPTVVDSPIASSMPGVIDQTINRDLSLLAVLTLQCCECLRHGAAKDGGFRLMPGLIVYCDACATAEAND